MSIHKLFDDKAYIYAKARPGYPSDLYKWISELCDERKAVWDVGCGSGQASIDLCKYFNFVEATDVSASQISNAPSNNQIRFSVQPAESTNFENETFDAVCVAQALHWFDYEKFWPEVKRVLKPSGFFIAWGYMWPHVNPGIDDVLNDTLFSVIRPYWAPQNKLLWDSYREVSIPFKRIDSPTFELTMDWSIHEFFAYLHSWSATRRCMDDQGDDFFIKSFNDISRLWPRNTNLTVTMDFVVVAGQNEAFQD